jgi:hypothetical protein
MNGTSKIALVVLAIVVTSSPALARHNWHSWRHGWHYHYGWYHHGYTPAVSDYYHHSRQLVGTR